MCACVCVCAAVLPRPLRSGVTLVGDEAKIAREYLQAQGVAPEDAASFVMGMSWGSVDGAVEDGNTPALLHAFFETLCVGMDTAREEFGIDAFMAASDHAEQLAVALVTWIAHGDVAVSPGSDCNPLTRDALECAYNIFPSDSLERIRDILWKDALVRQLLVEVDTAAMEKARGTAPSEGKALAGAGCGSGAGCGCGSGSGAGTGCGSGAGAGREP